MENKYKINGIEYKLTCRFDGELYEATCIDYEGNSCRLYGYGDTRGEAIRELACRLSEMDIRPGVENRLVLWSDLTEEQKRKIRVIARGVQSDVMSEWGTNQQHFEWWQASVAVAIEDIYPHPLSKSYYDGLFFENKGKKY